MAIFTSIATAIAAGIGMTLATTATATFVAVTATVLQVMTIAACMFGGMALSMSLSKKGGDYAASSPTYSATKQTQTNPDLPVPLLYGTVKVAGNRVWQDDNYNDGIKRIVGFSDGEITDFTDIRLNDIPISDISGIKIQKFYGTSEQGLPTGLPKGVGLEQLGSLKYLAYLYVNVPKSDKIDINYNLTTVIKGRKVRVYTTPTTYEVKYSENPAWIMFDFLTCYNGRGLCLKADGTIDDEQVAKLFDLNSFIESAAFCDEEVETNGVKTPRFTFNMIFDSQTSHKTLLDEIQRSCRGGLFTKNGKLQFKIDKAEPVSKVFTEDDILDGSETFQTLPNEENYEVLKIEYVSPEHEWNKIQAYAEIETTRTGVPITHSVNAYSITNFQQASRLAWYYLNSKRLCPYFGSFKTGFKAWDLEVGQVIKIPVILMGLKDYLVKVTSIVNNGTGTYTVNYRTYDERLYSDELGCKEPTVLVSNLDDQYGIPDNVRNFNVVQSQSYFNFVWQRNTNTQDVYEIRYGDTWENGKVIAKNLGETSFSWAIPSDGLYKFWIKAFNGYNYSESPTLDVYSVDALPKVNEIIKFNLFDDINGTFTDTYYYKRFKVIKVKSNVLWQTLTEKWSDNGYYSTYGKWGAAVANPAYYTSQVYDIGDVLSSIVSVNLQYECSDEGQTITPEWRFSTDGKTWSDWRVCNIGEYEFRYYQFRAVFHAYSGVQMFLKSFAVSVDVPDKELELDVEIPASGSLEINYNFINVPSIIGTVNDDVEAYVVVQSSSKTNKKAVIQAFKNDGTATGAKVNLRLKGY